jgi:D-alanine-D-alanine ligase
MPKKIRVGILFGGKSVEHEISLLSASNVIAALDRKKYTPVLLKIDKRGRWQTKPEVFFRKVDVVFPILHGPLGEDGTVQGLLKLAGVPFVGASVLGSAVGMDKDVMKRLLREAGIPVAKFITLRKGEPCSYREAVKLLDSPLFVKPANTGSSVGISKVKRAKDFKAAVQQAFTYDTKVIIEESIVGREIECAVLGNHKPIASIPGEVIPTHEFYSYEAKYLDEQGARIEVPAKLTQGQVTAVRKLSIEAFQVLECSGLGRVDFFLTERGELYVNEINTIPGFTSISMYPKLFEATGIPYAELIDRLIMLALERFDEEGRLMTSRL